MLDDALNFIRHGGGGGEIGIVARSAVVGVLGLIGLYVAAVVIFWGVALTVGLFQVGRDGLRNFKTRDRALSVPRHPLRLARQGAVVVGREIAEFAGILKRRHSADPALTRELGTWPKICRDDDRFLLRARHMDPAWVNFPGKASAWTGGVCFFIGLFGSTVDITGIIIGAVAFIIGAGLSLPVWTFWAASRLVISIEPGVISWHGGGKTGGLQGLERVGNWKMEVNPQHPFGPEEQRIHSENLRRGVIKPNAAYEPAFHNASRVVAQTGFMGRDWCIVAEIAGDREGQKAYKLQTAILYLHQLCEAEALNEQRSRQRGLARGMR